MVTAMAKAKIKIPDRFIGKDVTMRRAKGEPFSASLYVSGRTYHIDKQHAGEQVLIAQEPNGDLFGVAEMEGDDITFMPKPELLPVNMQPTQPKVTRF